MPRSGSRVRVSFSAQKKPATCRGLFCFPAVAMPSGTSLRLGLWRLFCRSRLAPCLRKQPRANRNFLAFAQSRKSIHALTFVRLCCPGGGMVDTRDLKSRDHRGRMGSSPIPGTTVAGSPSGGCPFCFVTAKCSVQIVLSNCCIELQKATHLAEIRLLF